MRAVIQRVLRASVTIDGKLHSSIGKGMMLFIGICDEDGEDDIDWLAKKVVNLRIFDDENGVMNRPVTEVAGEILAVSQFTLMASTRKGNRPSYIKAARPEISKPLYEAFCRKLSEESGTVVQTGVFGADMKCELINDGPVTIIIDTKNKE